MYTICATQRRVYTTPHTEEGDVYYTVVYTHMEEVNVHYTHTEEGHVQEGDVYTINPTQRRVVYTTIPMYRRVVYTTHLTQRMVYGTTYFTQGEKCTLYTRHTDERGVHYTHHT